MSHEGSRKSRRSYRPTVEALEALRLFSGAVPTLPDVPAEHAFLPEFDTVPVDSIATESPFEDVEAAWDTALGQTRLADLLDPALEDSATSAEISVRPEAISAGLSQLDRYLSRTWARSGIGPSKYDDCTQAVYLTLLQNLGRGGFDRLVGEVGQDGIKEVLSRETAEGPDFFRAIDTIKKRAQRERSFQPLDSVFEPPSQTSLTHFDWKSTIQEAIDRTLNPREAALIQATLSGETPAEIAEQWGVAPKTVSNEKSRAFQKLREFLVADLIDNG